MMLKNKKILLALFLLTVAAGVYYPAAKIISFEFPSSPPTSFRFAAALYDPYDLFRGRYVQLRANVQRVTLDEEKKFQDEKAYAVLEKDKDGFAIVVDLLPKPEPGKIAIRVEQFRRDRIFETDKYLYNVWLPFDRFYMNEKLAPEAEIAVREAVRQDGKGCVIVANVYANGNSTITDLLIDDIPIHEFLKKKMAEEKQ